MADIKLNHEKLIIEVTKKFMNKANIYNSKENRELLAAQRDYPGFKVVVNKGKSGKEYYNGLDYDYMEKYIKDHDDEKKSIMEEYLTLRGKSDEAQSANAKSVSYGKIKEWFLGTYPEIQEFHSNREDILKRVKENKKKQKVTAQTPKEY